MRLADLDYHLPPERIAQTPVEPRDMARLLVDRGDRGPEHRRVRDLPDLLRPGDLLVVNETRVIPARLALHRASGGAVEVLLLDPLDEAWETWDAMVRPARRLRDDEVLLDSDGLPAVRLGGRSPAGDTFTVSVMVNPSDVRTEPADRAERALARLDEIGQMPVPPYVHEPLAQPDRYQTVYARVAGSAAAPTAGLHLTQDVLDRLSSVGVNVAPVELTVGRDTFAPITVDDPLEHRIHTERYRVPPETLEACRATRAAGHRVVAVGTTSVRALESAALTGETSGRTALFIHPGHRWQLVDLLMTNFHQPRTTLLLMIEAFVGTRWRAIYRTALDSDYRFLSFGDAMLLDRHATVSGSLDASGPTAEGT